MRHLRRLIVEPSQDWDGTGRGLVLKNDPSFITAHRSVLEEMEPESEFPRKVFG